MKQKFIPSNYLWIDLEMTGLVPDQDVILEVAAEITDVQFVSFANYVSTIGYEKDVVLKRMAKNTWWNDFPENRDTFINGLESSKPLAEVEEELVALVDHHSGSEPAVLAGNSIQSDRVFIKQWMPKLESRLHYRMLDVTSWKLVMESLYGVSYEKPEVHRAYEDIQASIAELKFYLEWFKNNTHEA